MMSEEIDACGLSCPVPVIKAKQAIENMGAGEVQVLVDEEVAKENVSRLARSMGCAVQVEEAGGEFKLIISKGAGNE
jgi:TusA-related sulfurtransferase